MEFSESIYYLIAFLSALNLGRLLTMLVGSDMYDIRQILKNRHKQVRPYQPLVSVIIPAYNEEVGVIRTLTSVMENNYKRLQIIVVNDGSNDNTLRILRTFQRKNPNRFTVVSQANAGKAEAINRGVRYWAKGTLVMVLDADSLLHKTSIQKMVAHFRNRNVIAAASNVKIIPTGKMLGIAQRFEYLISYRMKRSLSIFNMEYIVGGVGSTFRRSALLKVGLFDTDTMTEDIDLTVKLIRIFGNTKYRIHYAADCLAYTEHVLTFKSLIRQRFRWKYGRLQTLLKNQKMFFSTSSLYDKRLTWYQLPYAIFGELALLIEPLLIGYILYVSILYGDAVSMLSVYAIVTAFVFLALLGEESEPMRTKFKLSAALPIIYILMYALTIVEFAALIKSIRGSRALFAKTKMKSSWEHVERSGGAVKL